MARDEAYREAEQKIEAARQSGANELYLGGMSLTELPEALGQLTQLLLLYLSNNRLTALPEALGQLTQLQKFHVSNNQLTELPEALGRLTHLQIFHVSNNQLTALPEGLGRLAATGKLGELYLHNNEALGIPPQILGPSDKILVSDNNRQLPEAKQLKPKPPVEMADYLLDHACGRLRPSNEAKLLVVGPGGHGKSSLIEYLVQQTFFKGKLPTEGIVITPWQVATRDQNPVQLNIWDFGGQEIQHSTHEFFLTDRSIYLLVCCARDDEAAKQGLYYWLDLIHLVAPEAPVIVALSKQDEIEYFVNDAADLKRLHPKLVDFIPVSCEPKSGKPDNRERLMELIEDTVRRELPHIRYRLPSAWVKVKEGLEKKGLDYLSYADFAEQCSTAGIKDADDQRELANILHALGTMLNYSDRLPLEQTHILNPRWVTEGVYAVALAPEVRAAGGVLNDLLLNRLLSAECHVGRYPASAQQFIRQMMLTFKLCYPLGARGGVMEYLVPNALPEDEPKDLLEITDALRFEIRFPRILPTGMMSRFIVAMHDQATTRHRWRLGLVGKLQGHPFSVTAHQKERVFRIAVGGTGRTRVSALDQIRQELAVIFREKKGLEVEEYTFPPGRRNAEGYKFAELLEAERAGQLEIWVGGGVGNVNVREWLDGVTDSVARRRYQSEVSARQGMFGELDMARMSIGFVERLEVTMGDDKSIQNSGSISGQARLSTGNEVNQGDQVQAILSGPAADLRKQLMELRKAVAELRGGGASAEDCDVAEDAVAKIEGALQKPQVPSSRKEAKGAMATLKGLADGFGNVAKIGGSFAKILGQAHPFIDKVFQQIT
jgi:small GTP-binding protein